MNNHNNVFFFNKINIFSSLALHFFLIIFIALIGELENKNQEILPTIIKVNTLSDTISKNNKIKIKKKQKAKQIEKKNTALNKNNSNNIIKEPRPKKFEKNTKKIEFKNSNNKNLKQENNKTDINHRKAKKEMELNNLKKVEIEKNNVNEAPLIKKSNEGKKNNKNILTENEEKIFLKYKEDLAYLIQQKATKNYPRRSIRKHEIGNVELIFLIDKKGYIKNIKIGKKTNAPERLIKASIKTLEQISQYKKNKILEKKNNFSIIIIYKLN